MMYLLKSSTLCSISRSTVPINLSCRVQKGLQGQLPFLYILNWSTTVRNAQPQAVALHFNVSLFCLGFTGVHRIDSRFREGADIRFLSEFEDDTMTERTHTWLGRYRYLPPPCLAWLVHGDFIYLGSGSCGIQISVESPHDGDSRFS